MERADFLFTIGYQGNSAIVDERARKSYGKLSTAELLEKGLFKPAFCSALYSGDPAEQEEFLRLFNEKTGASYVSVEQIKRLFGVFEVPSDVIKITSL